MKYGDTYLKCAFGDHYEIMVRRLEEVGYWEQPASKGHHLAVDGGLAMHSANVTGLLARLSKEWNVLWSRKESPFLVGMLHDLVKCLCYVRGADGRIEYRQPVYPGHGACSVAVAMQLGIDLRPDEIAAITYHMGPWGVGKEYTQAEFDAGLRDYGAQIIAVHSVDWYASNVEEKEAGRC